MAKTPSENVFQYQGCRISILKENLLRIEYGEVFVDEASQKILHRDFGIVPFKKNEGENLCLEIGPYAYFLDLRSFSDSFVLFQGRKVFFSNDENLKGASRTLDMSAKGEVHFDDAVTGERKEIPYRDPAILSDGVVAKNGLALIDDASSLLFGDDCLLKPNPLKHDYYIFFFPNDPESAVKALYDLTERPPMLPRFVFGNWWSRYRAYTDREYLSVIQKFVDKDVPLSVATIDMDWHYVDLEAEFKLKENGFHDSEYGSHSGWTGWTWNHHLFPNHKSFLKSLKDLGLKVTLNLHPSEGIRFFESAYPEFAKGMGIDPKSKVAIPFDFANSSFIREYFNMLHKMEEEGVDFWWIDWQQGSKSKLDGYDPLWGLNHHHYLDSCKGGKRGLILSRYSELGSHRYPLGFSGDTIQTWDVLNYVISFTARSANSGYTFWSHDIGAHHAGTRDGELYLRWLQFGLYSPVMRLHSYCSDFSGKEPWNYPKDIEVLAEEVLRERVRLIPYLYTQAYLNHERGQCFIRPLYYRNPEDSEAYHHETEYYLGDLLIAPVSAPLQNGTVSQTVYLPEGDWVDLSSDIPYRGNKVYQIHYGLGDIPRFLKEGSIVYRAKTHKELLHPSALEFLLLRGTCSTFVYEDDGESLNYREGKFCKTVVSQSYSEGKRFIRLRTEGDPSFLPKKRDYDFKLIHESPNSVSANRPFSRFDYETYSLLRFQGIAPDEELEIQIEESGDSFATIIRLLRGILIRQSFGNAEGDKMSDDLRKAENSEQLSALVEKWDLNPVAKSQAKQIIAYYCNK